MLAMDIPEEPSAKQSENGIIVEKGGRNTLVILQNIETDAPIFFDFYALTHADKKVKKNKKPEREPEDSGDNMEEDGERGANGADDGESKKGKHKKKARRKRMDEEDYDLNDPFIDDDEEAALAGGNMSLFDMLAGVDSDDDGFLDDDEGGDVLPVAAQRLIKTNIEDFYVWKGKLPEEEEPDEYAGESPLAFERAPRLKKNKKSERKKTTKAKQPSAGEAKGSRKRKSPNSDEDSAETKTAFTPLEADDSKKETKKKKKSQAAASASPKKAKKDKAIAVFDRIAALGESERDEPSIDMTESPKEPTEEDSASSKPLSQVPSQTPIGTTDDKEKVRKKFDISTPFMELELKLALEGFTMEAKKTTFDDPKKFPSSLRPYCNEALICCLRLQDKKVSLPESFFDAICAALPFPRSAVEKMVLGKLVPYYRDELKVKLLPQLFTDLKSEVTETDATTAQPSEGKKKPKMTDKIRVLIYEIVRTELDIQALDRLARSFAAEATPETPSVKIESFSEVLIRKNLYPKICACWPEGAMPTSQDIGKECSNIRRKIELRKLKEHNIEVEPTLIPIKSQAPKEATQKETKSAEAKDEEKHPIVDVASPLVEVTSDPLPVVKIASIENLLSTDNDLNDI